MTNISNVAFNGTNMKNYLNILRFNMIKNDNSKLRIWEKLDNGCFIGTMGYSEENIPILLDLLQSFSEQYGEVIDYEAAKEELQLYQDKGKLFIYFNEDLKPISMNGVIYDEDNVSVDFIKKDGSTPSNLYFYGLSTLKEYRGLGACHYLMDFVFKYAYYNNFDLVYARTDLVNSNSEGIMKDHGMDICMWDDKIIAEWVDVTDDKGDYRLHLWVPLKKGIGCFPKEKAVFADKDTREIEDSKIKVKTVC